MSATDDIETRMEQGNTRVKKYIESFINCPKILIAFVNGPAIGISVSTLGLFDGVYASSSSTFSLPFVRLAQSLEGCSSYVFPSLMGSLHAKEVLLFDRKLTAVEAQQRGLVTKVIDEKIFEQEKRKICEEILSLPKGSLLTSKALMQRWNIDTLKKVNQEELDVLKKRLVSEEFVEAMMAFMNRKNKSKL
jgi:peroxisomal 3,2-trans-enoyl-CoA isomerase